MPVNSLGRGTVVVLMPHSPPLRSFALLFACLHVHVQWKTIPPALAGHDICGSAQTGSGKTAAFLLPAIERLLFRDKRIPATRVVVVLPTRELATQCHEVAVKLCKYTDIRCCVVVGGLSLKTQEAELRTRPDIVIGTPGRLLDHLKNSPSIHFDNVDILVCVTTVARPLECSLMLRSVCRFWMKLISCWRWASRKRCGCGDDLRSLEWCLMN